MTIDHPASIRIAAGQHINVWMPGISFWSRLQSHPFVVACARPDTSGTILEMLVEPRHGRTARLLREAQVNGRTKKTEGTTRSFLTLFSGPHGRSANRGIMAL